MKKNPRNTIKKLGGRPTDYQTAYNEQAFKLTLLGAHDAELADFFEVNEDTIYEWKIKHKKFSDSIKDGKIKADSQVATRLYDRAMGAEWTEDQAFKVKKIKYKDGRKLEEYEEVITVPVRKAAAPDTSAISLWLRNRNPARWKDKVEINHAGGVTNTFALSDDLMLAAREELKRISTKL